MIALRRIGFLGSLGRVAAIGLIALTAGCGGGDMPTSNPGSGVAASQDVASAAALRVQTANGGAETSQRIEKAGERHRAMPSIASGDYHSIALKSDGTVLAWGYGVYGQLGNDSTADSSIPVRVVDASATGMLTGVSRIAGGGFHSLALKRDGTVWAWGYGANGQLGNNSSANFPFPVQVVGAGGSGVLTGVTAIAGGDLHSLALKADGTVWAWGSGVNGQLGNNSSVNSSVPVQVKGAGGIGVLTGVVAIAGGGFHSLALKSDGTVWAWGYDEDGELGNNSIASSSSVPVQVVRSDGTGMLTGVVAIAGGGYHSLALRSRTVLAWGWGFFGQLGNNGTAAVSAPVQVVGAGGTGRLTSVAAIAGGTYHSLALKGDGTVWAWGRNFSGQLGNNDNIGASVPVQVVGAGGTGSLTDVAAIAGGSDHSLALKDDGTVWAWGGNLNGQLGNNSTADSSVPVQVLGPDGVGFLKLRVERPSHLDEDAGQGPLISSVVSPSW